jgi:hypothetical protein
MKLSHAASTTLTAIAELQVPIGVGSGVLLGCLFLVCILPFINGSLKHRLHLSTPKPSLSELVKIYLNPRTALRAVGDGMEKLHRMLKGWECVIKSGTIFRLFYRNPPSNPIAETHSNNKLSTGFWRNLLCLGRLKNKRVREMWMPKMNPNLPDEQRHILSVVSDDYIDGSRITIYACLKSEWKPSLDYIQAEPDEILNPSYACNHNGENTHKSKDVAKQPNEKS